MDKYCALPFMHLQVKPNQQYKPCCRFQILKHPELMKFNANDFTPGEVLNSDEWKDLRNKMLSGESIKGCSRCYSEEDRNISSMRNGINHKHGVQEEVKLKYLEVSFGNFCNLKCRTCSVDLSSSWYEEEKELLPFYKSRTNQNTKVIYVNDEYHYDDYKDINEIKFTGGEPMLHPNFEKFIDFLIDNNLNDGTELDIFSNCSWFPKERVVDKLKRFRNVIINLSVDGVGKVNDYARFPSKWNDVDLNANKWIATNFDVRWVPCISVYNVHNIIDMFEWWLSKDHKNIKVGSKLNITLNTVDYPTYMAPNLFTNKEKYVKQLEEYKNSKTFPDILNIHFKHLINKSIQAINKKVNEKDLEEFLNFSADLDKLRKQNIHDFIPELDYDFTKYGKL